MADQKVTAQTPSHKGNAPINNAGDILNIAFAPLANFILTLDSIPGDELDDNNLNARRTAETLQALFDHGRSTALKEFAKARDAGVEVTGA